MKKVLSILSLIAILGLSSPVFAAPNGPGGHGGPGGPGPRGGHHIHAGSHHRHHMAPRHHHGGGMIHVGHYPRHNYWRSYGPHYWGNHWCDYRLGCYGPYYPAFGVHIPMGNASFSVRF